MSFSPIEHRRSRGLAEAMSGTLSIEHTPGGGLTMVLALPSVEGET